MDEITLISNFEHNILGDWLYIEFRIQRTTKKCKSCYKFATFYFTIVSCKPKCANGGFCIGHNSCSCPHGFSGPLCQDRTCTIHCENGGVCTMPGNKCKCRNGFYGSRCHKR